MQERAARLLRLEDAGLAFDAEIFLNAATPGHQFDERGRAVGIELIGYQYPTRIGIGFDSGCNVGGEIRFGSRWSDRRADDFAGDDIEVRDQTQGPMSAILELDTLHQARPSRFGFIQTLKGLDAGFLLDAHEVCACRRKLRRVAVDVADPLDVGLVLRRGFPFVPRVSQYWLLCDRRSAVLKKVNLSWGDALDDAPFDRFADPLAVDA